MTQIFTLLQKVRELLFPLRVTSGDAKFEYQRIHPCNLVLIKTTAFVRLQLPHLLLPLLAEGVHLTALSWQATLQLCEIHNLCEKLLPRFYT